MQKLQSEFTRSEQFRYTGTINVFFLKQHQSDILYKLYSKIMNFLYTNINGKIDKKKKNMTDLKSVTKLTSQNKIINS